MSDQNFTVKIGKNSYNQDTYQQIPRDFPDLTARLKSGKLILIGRVHGAPVSVQGISSTIDIPDASVTNQIGGAVNVRQGDVFRGGIQF